MQAAWLDERTTHGSWRIAKDFPKLPARVCKTVGGTTTHWAAASLRFQPHEFEAKSAYGDVRGANLLDWPIGYDETVPWYEKAEDEMGVAGIHAIPGLPGNDDLKVFCNVAVWVG